MYFYFYDQFVQEKQYEVLLTKIEARLIELGINGRIEKLALFKNTRELIEDGIKKGAHTIVAVGDDKTLASLVNIVVHFPVTLGFIPVKEQSRFATILGIPMGPAACIVLSRRRTMITDVGVVNGAGFLGSIHLPINTHFRLRCDDQYTITATNAAEIALLNLGNIFEKQNHYSPLRVADANDGQLQVIVMPSTTRGILQNRHTASRESIFFVKQVHIEPIGQKEAQLVVDAQTNIVAPCDVTINSKTLKIIVGRERKIGTSD